MNCRKWYKYAFVFFICLICTSCASKNEMNSSREFTVMTEGSKEVEEIEIISGDVNGEITIKKADNDLIEKIKEIIGQNSLLDVCIVSKNVVLILIQEEQRGKGYFFDISSNGNIVEIENVPLASEYRVSCYLENIVLLASSGDCLIFDKKYSLQEKFNLYKKFYFGIMKSVCVLPKSQKIIYSKDIFGEKFLWCMYSADYKNKNKKRILTLEQGTENLNYVNSCSNIVASDNEKNIFFLGEYYSTANEQAKHCYGCFNIKSKKMYVYYDKRTEKIAAKNMLLAGEEAYFYDGMQEEKNYTGNVYCVGEGGKQTVWKLEDKREGENVILSDVENYIVTYYWDSTDKGKEKTIINIYDRKNFEKISTLNINETLHDVMVFENGVMIGLGLKYKGKSLENVFVQRKWKNEK